MLNPKGIKVLSLFFIDKVSNYREYDKDYNHIEGKYAKMFEEEYSRLITLDKYRDNENKDLEVSRTHFIMVILLQTRKKGKKYIKTLM